MLTDWTDSHRTKNALLPNGLGVRSPLSVLPQKRLERSRVDMGQRIRQFARGQNCTLRLPGCNNDSTTVVFAHAPSIDNAMGMKQAKDFWGAFACSHCHDVVDGRVTTSDQRILILERWMAGIYETMKRLIAADLLHYDDR